MKKWGILIVLLLTACRVGPNYTRPSQALPKSVISKKDTISDQKLVLNKKIAKQWWQVFHSSSLNQLIQAGFQHNPDVAAAKASLLAAHEEILSFQGVYFPFVGFSASPSKQAVAKILTSVLASNQYNYSLYTGQLFVSYAPDVFGGNRRIEESLIAFAHYQQFQLEATYLTLASNVVNAAIQEAAIRAKIQATKNLIQEQEDLVKITQRRQHLGDASNYDVHTEEEALANAKSTLPPLNMQLAQTRNLINALTGRFPGDSHTPQFLLNQLRLPAELPIALPADLLEHRPDIRAAEEQMRAANAMIGVAISNRLPNISLGFTNLGTTATNLGDLFSPTTNFWSLVGILAQPIYDAGTLKHKQKVAEALYAEAAAQYRSTIIQAFQNTADTLSAIREDNRIYQQTLAAKNHAATNLKIARKQWNLGDLSTATLLSYLQDYQQTQMNFIQAEANRLSDSVALFQALGGNWWINAKRN